MKQQTYQFAFVADNLIQQGLTAILKDTYKNTSTPISLEDTTKINFDVNADAASQGAGRFFIVFQNASASPLPVTFISVKASQQTTGNNNVIVQWNVTNQLNIKEYELERSVDGITFFKVATITAKDGISVQYNLVDSQASIGENFYRILSINSNSSFQYSKIVNLEIGTNPLTTIYPNPIINNTIGLQLSNMPFGDYRVRFLNIKGQELMKLSISISSSIYNKKIIIA